MPTLAQPQRRTRPLTVEASVLGLLDVEHGDSPRLTGNRPSRDNKLRLRAEGVLNADRRTRVKLLQLGDEVPYGQDRVSCGYARLPWR